MIVYELIIYIIRQRGLSPVRYLFIIVRCAGSDPVIIREEIGAGYRDRRYKKAQHYSILCRSRIIMKISNRSEYLSKSLF